MEIEKVRKEKKKQKSGGRVYHFQREGKRTLSRKTDKVNTWWETREVCLSLRG